MNAVIALCHFCEVHGPSVVFCTQTSPNSDEIQINPKEEAACRSCVSLGPYIGFLSKDQDEINYVSTQNCIAAESLSLLKQACVRSLSCEVSQRNDGGFVYFGDSSHGHVLSHTFQVADAQSRGFYRWFSIIILMKDKIFLLNLSPFLSEHLQIISKEIQQYAQIVYNEEQSHCSQRALRLSNSQSNPPQMRSLSELTHKTHIFAHLHTKFSWLLKTGKSYYKECPLRIRPNANSAFTCTDTEEGFTIVHLNNTAQIENESQTDIGIRNIKEVLGSNIFNCLLYCILIGKQVIIRGSGEKILPILNVLRDLLLPENNKPSKISLGEIYKSPKLTPLLALGLHVAVPQPCEDIFRIDATDDRYIMKWTGKLPEKCPTLYVKIQNAIQDERLSDSTLSKHITALIEECQSTTMAVKCSRKGNSDQELECLYKILGVQAHDKILIDNWCERYTEIRNKIS